LEGSIFVSLGKYETKVCLMFEISEKEKIHIDLNSDDQSNLKNFDAVFNQN